MFLLAHRWLQPKAKAPNPPAAELAQVGRVTEIWKRLCDQARYYLEVCALKLHALPLGPRNRAAVHQPFSGALHSLKFDLCQPDAAT
jgi:hypothetical protein